VIDVVIAGAGPNGLMLACELAMAGVRVVVVDPLPGPNPAPRANGIVGQGVRILDHRGLYEALYEASADEPGPPRPAPGHMFAAFPLDLTAGSDSQLYRLFVPQPKLVQVLAARAAEHDTDIRWGHALTGFAQHGDAVTVAVDGSGGSYELTAHYLVGADGGTSTTRKLAGIDFPGTSSHDVVARLAFGVLPPDEWIDHDTATLDIPGLGRLGPSPFVRTERGVFVWMNFNGRSAAWSWPVLPSTTGPAKNRLTRSARSAFRSCGPASNACWG
jgi:2-polyprenyl-6-methoxyphenol hydroxylase-like FAD-dependent oxidoreductase